MITWLLGGRLAALIRKAIDEGLTVPTSAPRD